MKLKLAAIAVVCILIAGCNDNERWDDRKIDQSKTVTLIGAESSVKTEVKSKEYRSKTFHPGSVIHRKVTVADYGVQYHGVKNGSFAFTDVDHARSRSFYYPFIEEKFTIKIRDRFYDAEYVGGGKLKLQRIDDPGDG